MSYENCDRADEFARIDFQCFESKKIRTDNNARRKRTTTSAYFFHIDSCPASNENSESERSDSEGDPESRERLQTATNSLPPETELLSKPNHISDFVHRVSLNTAENNPEQTLVEKSNSNYFETNTNFGSLKSTVGENGSLNPANSVLKNSASICQAASCAISGNQICTSYIVSTKAVLSAQPGLSAIKVRVFFKQT